MERLAQIILVAFVLCCALIGVSEAQADERVFSEYIYDEVGNIIARRQDKSGAAPAVDTVSPSTVRQNQTVRITLDGQGLRGAQLVEQTSSQSNGSFSFSDIVSTNQQLEFTLGVAEDAAQGPTQVSVSTGLGTTFFSLNVLQELPDLRVSPSPLTFSPGSTSELNISLSTIDVLDHTVTLVVDDPAIATVSVNQIEFTTSGLGPSSAVSVSALSEGVTTLRFESETLENESYTLRVSNDGYVLEPGSTQSFNSQAVGLNKLFTPPPPDLVAQGPFFSELRINKQFTPASSALDQNAFSNPVGLLKGRYHLAPSPKAIGAGAQNSAVTVEGNGLADVTSVQIEPAENIQIDNVQAASNGESVSFDISVDADTPLTLRRLQLQDSLGAITSSTPQANRLYIGGSAPLVESVSPIYLNRGDVRTITVRGQNFQTVRGLRFDNNENLVFSAPTVAQDGQSLTFGLEVVGFATLGPRALILESLLGDSTALHSAANIINFEDRPPSTISPVVAPAVGVNRLSNDEALPEQATARALLVGVSRGDILNSITPNARAQGSSVTLELAGQGLTSVSSIEFEPSEGITVGVFTPNAAGDSATLAIEIASDAEPTQRRIKLNTVSGTLNAVNGADRFTVTLPRPQVESVSPILVNRSLGNVPLTIRGQLLNDASLVTVIPPQGITASVPSASADGKEVSVSLTLALDAPLTPRVIQITTLGGSTESAAMISNTINVVSEVGSVITPIVSSQVGVVREVTPVAQTQEISSLSSGVGIVKQFTPVSDPESRLAYANPVGIAKGATALSISPSILPINSQSQTIEVQGVNLDNVTTVQTVPADGISLSGPAIISADGSRVTFSATVAADAPQTARRLELITADGAVPFAIPANSQLLVTGLQPQIESIDPIQQVRGASFTMTIRGINLVDVQSVQATPANGVQFGTPNVAADARSLTVQVIIDPAASTEQKVISVTTNAGTTSSAAMPENTFTVISE